MPHINPSSESFPQPDQFTVEALRQEAELYVGDAKEYGAGPLEPWDWLADDGTYCVIEFHITRYTKAGFRSLLAKTAIQRTAMDFSLLLSLEGKLKNVPDELQLAIINRSDPIDSQQLDVISWQHGLTLNVEAGQIGWSEERAFIISGKQVPEGRRYPILHDQSDISSRPLGVPAAEVTNRSEPNQLIGSLEQDIAEFRQQERLVQAWEILSALQRQTPLADISPFLPTGNPTS